MPRRIGAPFSCFERFSCGAGSSPRCWTTSPRDECRKPGLASPHAYTAGSRSSAKSIENSRTRNAARRSVKCSGPKSQRPGSTRWPSHPLYGRFWRVGWEALRRGVYHLDPEDLLPLSPTWEIYERWCFVALARKLREWLRDYAWSNTGTTGSDRRRVIGRRSDGHQITLHLQKTFQRKDGVEQTEAWSISRQCVPDLVLKSETGDGATRFIVLDAKYRTGEQNILNGMAESAHLYHDALRWGPRRPERALLLVPNADETEWLSREDYVNKHHVGVVALRPDIEWPEWLRNLITAHPALAPRSSATDS